MMRLMRRSSSATDTASTSTNRELKRLLLLLLTAGLIASIAWVALMISGTAFDALGRFREGLLRTFGFGSVLLAGWAIAFIFALAFRRHWLRRYNLWLASAVLVIAAVGALSFLSPSEGLLGWFALGGEVTPGGQIGDMIIGSKGWTGWLRVIAALAVAGALFALPAFRAVGDALISLFNRRRETMSDFQVTTSPLFDEQEEDTRTAPAPAWGVSSDPVGFGNGLGTSYTNSGTVGARESLETRSNGESSPPYATPDFSQPREPFDFWNVPRRSAPVPSLANYLDGISGSDSLEAGIRNALAEPPAPEPAASEPNPYDDDDPFKPLNLSKLPEPVFAFRTEPEPVVEVEEEDEPDTPDVSVSELPDIEEFDDQAEDTYDEPEDELIDEDDFDFDGAASFEPAPEAAISDNATAGEDSDSVGVVISDAGQDDIFMSQFNSAPSVVEAGDQSSFNDPYIEPSSESVDLTVLDSDRGDFLMSDFDSPSGGDSSSPLLEYDDSDRGDLLIPDIDSLSDSELFDIPRDEDGADTGDSLTNFDSSGTIVDASDQPTFDDSVTETSSAFDNEPESVIIEEFDPDYLEDSDSPMPGPVSAQPNTPFKTNKYWTMDSDVSESPAPRPEGLDKAPAQPSRVDVPVVSSWRKPSIRMLNTAPSNTITVEEQRGTANAITRTLGEYGIEVGVKHIRPGPTVTMYGLTPGWVRRNKTVKQFDANGMPMKDEKGRLVTKQIEEKTRVKVDSILAREKDLSLALKTPSIRLETPAMGKSLIGIEVPNPNPSLVTLRSIMESSEFQGMRDDGSHLPVALGQGSGGEPVVFDLAKMPHLLVAGATGSGKSVCLNAIVSCLITEKTPAEMRMILVDPKRVELTPYNGVPHLLAPVIVETDTVVGYLKGLIREMFERYRRMEEVGVRNIEAYNNRMADKMPFLCVVIDELADLMMTAAVDVEQSICRLAQLGRATGIHMIIATQRPSVDVLTGLIKANFPSRISFGVTSQVDSRTILDTGGADKLLGRGDMLYLPLDASKPSRVQSVFIGDSEIEKLVDFWQSTPHLPLDEIDLLGGAEAEMGSESVEDDPDRDEMIDKAIEIALSHRKLSTSLLQRRLRIGYPRAARLMDQLEEEGIVGPGDGSKSRDVIMNQN